jgi:hypothetical protein
MTATPTLRVTISPSPTADMKTTYNKVAGQHLFHQTVAPTLTATLNIGKQILHSGRLAHGAQAEFCLYSFMCAKNKPPAIKNTYPRIIILLYN